MRRCLSRPGLHSSPRASPKVTGPRRSPPFTPVAQRHAGYADVCSSARSSRKAPRLRSRRWRASLRARHGRSRWPSPSRSSGRRSPSRSTAAVRPPRILLLVTLRLFHTADWHLGHTLHGVERTYEHERLMAWLLQTIERESVDAVLVAGDVFDAANRPTEAQALWYRFLVEAWRRVPHVQVVVIGGNHDSGARLDATDPFLRAMERLPIVGCVTRRDGRPALARV